MKPSLDTWTIIFLIAAVQGLFLALMLFLRSTKINSILAGLVLAFSLCLLYYVAFWTRYEVLLPDFIAAAQGLTFLFGPLTFLYIKSDKKTVQFNLWHFLPFALYLAFFFSRELVPVTIRKEVVVSVVLLQNAHLVFYSGMILFWLKNQHSLKNGALKEYNWKKKVGAAFSAYTCSFLTYYILVWTDLLKIEYDYAISLTSSFFIYFIGYHGYRNPEVLKIQEQAKYEKSALPESASRSILATLKMHMATHKPYLDSSLKLQQLSEQLSISSHHISQVINELENQNFSDFINEYRINDAKRILSDPAFGSKKLIHIAYDTGFNNKASFYNAFKKHAGISPSDYRNTYLTNSREIKSQ